MINKLFLFIISLFIFSACVSKKKYNDVLMEKDHLSKQLRDKKEENKKLSSDLESAVADYENMRYKLGKSNAIKSDEVSDLIVKSSEMQATIDNLNDQLKNIKDDLNYNKQNALKTAEDLDLVKKQILQLKRDTAGLHYSINLAKERNEMLNKELVQIKEKYNTLFSDFSTYKDEAQKKDLKLKSLEKQLISQKHTIESISNAFIGLRKQLLTAKTNNEAIDPNKNSYIDKIAKLLGHY